MPDREFIINPNILDGYPSIQTINKGFSPVQEAPYPNLLFNINPNFLDGYPNLHLTFSPAQEQPLPNLLMGVDNNYLLGYPSFRRNFGWSGAFAGAENITSATISSDVNIISDYVFNTTQLANITLGHDTIYYSHTFPINCTVTGGNLKQF